MPRKRHKADEIVTKLRQVDVLTAQGRPVAEAIRSIGVTEVTYYRWRSEYGGLKGDQVKRLKELEAENTRLRRAVSDLTLEKLILKEAASRNFGAPRVAAPAWSMSSPNTASPSGSPAGFSASTANVGYPKTIRVDQGSEFVSRDLDLWAYAKGVTLDFSRPGKPTDNAFIEAFNGRFRAECLNTHWFLTLADAAEKMEDWLRYYNEDRPHGAIGNKAPILLHNRDDFASRSSWIGPENSNLGRSNVR